jgi:phage terminase Nu1 subunit (DNA packaging protein)
VVNASVTGAELAALLGLTDRHIRALAGKGLPRSADGTYPLGAAIRWYVSRKAAQSAPKGLLAARTRREEAAASKAELELARLRGELMTVEDYRRVVDDTFARVAAKLNALHNRAAPQLVGCRTVDEASTRLRAEVDEILSELCEAEDVPEAA